MALFNSYSKVISAFSEPIFLLTTTGRLVTCNPAAAELLSSDDESVFVESTHQPSSRELQDYLRQCAGSRGPLVGALELRTPTGIRSFKTNGAVVEPRTETSEAVVLLRLLPKLNSNTHFKALKDQIQSLNTEIAKRRRAEHDFRSKSRWLEITLSSIGDAVITTDSESRITFMNPVAEAMTGWTTVEAAMRPVDDVFVVVNEFSGEPVVNPARRALEESKVVALANHTVLITRNGSMTSIEDTAAPIMIDGHVEGVILVFHDISTRRLLEQQLLDRAERLERANRRKTEFMTMLAHELRSPLGPISNAAEVMNLQAETPLPPDSPQRVIGRQVQLLKRLVDDMLDVSRIASGKMNVLMEATDLCSLVRLACEDFESTFHQSKIQFSWTIPPTEVWVRGDSHRLTQVLHNLLTNAGKFTPPGGSTTVSLNVKSGFAILRVMDTGVGIEEAVMAELFQPFTQAAQALDRNRGGLGLGLSLVKGIIDLHGGTVSAESRGTNRGATFTISLPLTDEEGDVAGTPPRNKPRVRHRVLVIEDEQDAANTLRALLEALGNEVHLAATGPEGVIKAVAVEPSIVICDIGLPGLDGFEVAKRLRQSQLTASVPLVALTGYGDDEFIARAREAGFDQHVTKPASLAELEAVLSLNPRKNGA